MEYASKPSASPQYSRSYRSPTMTSGPPAPAAPVNIEAAAKAFETVKQNPRGAALAALPGIAWAGYLSTTGVYGDRQGGWVEEDSAREPTGERGRRRDSGRKTLRGAVL